MRLGQQLNNKELIDWARSEASGYKSVDELPDYRIFSTQARGKFSGPFGSGIDNAPIPPAVIDKEHRDSLFKVYLMQPVGELEELAIPKGETNSIILSWPANLIMYYQQREIYTGYSLSSAWNLLTTTTIVGVLETIKARVLDFVLAIEDEMGVDVMHHQSGKEPGKVPDIERTTQIFYTTIQGGDNISLGNSGATNQQAIHVQPGDLESLKEQLSKLGLTAEVLKDLDAALAKDSSSEEQPGPATQSWLARVMIMIGKGTLKVASKTAGAVINAEIRKYLGLPLQ